MANATDAEVIPLKHALAADLVPLVQRLIGLNTAAAPAGTSDTSFKTTLMAEARSNAVIVRAANGAQMALVRSLIQKLDQPDVDSGNGLAGNIHVVYLKNADATKLAVTLRAAMSNSASPATAAVTTTAAAGTPASPAVTTGANPGGCLHQFTHHHRARAAIPPTARGD